MSTRAQPSTLTPLGPDSVAWQVVGDRRLLLGAGTALLLQVAHPVVGAGVHDHSNFTEDPWGRLDRTIDSLLSQVFGGREAIAEAERLRELHKTIKGVDHHGERYHALNPEAYWWVHGSTFWTTVRMQDVFVRPLSHKEKRRLYAEWRQLGLLLGLREHHMPSYLEAFEEYFDDVVANRLEDNHTVRELLESISMRDTPPPPWWFLPETLWRPVRPAGGNVLTLCAIGLLPSALRERLSLKWTDADERRLRRLAAVTRTAGKRAPDRLRLYPKAYRAQRG
ncbi:oxygenase MpaB family protein [Amycolatopsis pittospori]|uniref:oxygenase MpaB family protein n=1 Tax=Amycolatopsis pittospori TaxID=2749434 RepID=UPI0015F0860A|nr:oxygenase MpaB family protein [Amycolatopsis pittospori]